jgi:hypothetical protein
MRYSKKEDEIIVRTLRQYSRKGAPLNIQAALDEAGDIIHEELGVNRSLGSLSQHYYSKIRKAYKIFGYQNVKSTFKQDIVVPVMVEIDGKPYELTLNLKPALVKHLVNESRN